MSNPKLHRGRCSQIGSYYAVTVVTRSRIPLFAEVDAARQLILELNSDVLSGSAYSIAWVVMPEHLHWLFKLKSGDLSQVVQALKSRSTRNLNRLQRSRGSIWQSGFYDHRLRDEDDLARQARYIITNPLRRGLISRLRDYPYWWCRFVGDESDL